MDIIKVENLYKTFKIKEKKAGLKESIRSIISPKYKYVTAVKNISFSLEEGEMLAFIGPKGAGKSTVIKLLTGILYPDEGKINILNLNPQKNRDALVYKIGTVFGQKEQLWSYLTLYDNFKFFGTIYNLSYSEINKKVRQLSDLFNLYEFMNTPIRNLSLGQRILCEISVSLIHNPRILFLDEPTIGLDPYIKNLIRKFIKDLNRNYNTTVFLTSHDINDIDKICKRIIIMNNGQIVIDNHLKTLKQDYWAIKLIEILTKEKIDAPKLEGVKVEEHNNNILKLSVNLKQVSTNVVMQNLDYSKILDFNISNIPLEKIIAKIYEEKIC